MLKSFFSRIAWIIQSLPKQQWSQIQSVGFQFGSFKSGVIKIGMIESSLEPLQKLESDLAEET